MTAGLILDLTSDDGVIPVVNVYVGACMDESLKFAMMTQSRRNFEFFSKY